MSGFGAELERWMRARGVGVRGLHRRSGYSAGYITQLRQGRRNPSPEAARDLDDALDAGGTLAASVHSRDGVAPVRRWASTGLTGSLVFEGMQTAGPQADGDALAAALSDLSAAGQQEPVRDIGALAASVDTARAYYQDCRYAQLAGSLADLIVTLNASCAALDGHARDRAHVLSADAHHVAAGLMLKRGDLGLATLAADRSMRAALASGDPVAIAASARIITHALLSGGHLAAAVATATSYASRLDRDLPGKTPQSLSVYGALLLRGAVAAAQADNRHNAAELLGEAGEAARRLGRDGNYCWTAFGPVNAAVHRVSIAVTLGDAGTALDVARSIPVDAVTVPSPAAPRFAAVSSPCGTRASTSSSAPARSSRTSPAAVTTRVTSHGTSPSTKPNAYAIPEVPSPRPLRSTRWRSSMTRTAGAPSSSARIADSARASKSRSASSGLNR